MCTHAEAVVIVVELDHSLGLSSGADEIFQEAGYAYCRMCSRLAQLHQTCDCCSQIQRRQAVHVDHIDNRALRGDKANCARPVCK
jgi:hypothetical protein